MKKTTTGGSVLRASSGWKRGALAGPAGMSNRLEWMDERESKEQLARVD